jgi:hypothetical protein
MRTRLTMPAAAATALMLLGACSDDGSTTTLAKGDGVEFEENSGLSGETMDITAEENGGEVTGELQFNDLAASLACADTGVDRRVVLGGQITRNSDTEPPVGDWMAVIIWEGAPDRVVLSYEKAGAESCRAALERVPDDIADGINVTDVADGYDIQTG